ASPTPVTTVTESIEYTINNTTYVIFNIPGLIEAKQEQIDLNKQEINKAFQLCPNAVVIYVFGNQSGRIRNEDIVAFHALNNAYPFASKSLVLVVNGIPVDREENYEGILDAAPTKHHKRQDIHLQMDEIKSLKDQYNQIQSEFKKQREKYRTEIETFQQRHEQEMKEKQQVFERTKEEMLSQQRRYHELHSQLLHQQHLQQGANTVATALCLTRNPYAMLIGALIALGMPTISKELHDGKK
ncbi:unnamed protein product, partial [Rotaria sp. Silwood1]